MNLEQYLLIGNLAGWSIAGWYYLKNIKLLKIAKIQLSIIDSFVEFLKIVNDKNEEKQAEDKKEAA